METSKVSPNSANYSLPRGRLSFNMLNESGVAKGEIDIGNCVSLDLTNAATWKDHESSHTGVVILDAKKQIAQRYNVKFTPEERSLEIMKMFFLGDATKTRSRDATTLIQAGGTELSVIVTVFLDRWIDLGKKYIKPGTIMLDAAPVVPGEFISIDYENGLLMVKTGQMSWVDGVTYSATFMYGGFTLNKIIPRTKPIIGFMRYRGLSESGPRHSVEMWKVQITPDAALALIKPNDIGGFSFAGEVFIDDDTGAHTDDPFFRIVELDPDAVTYPES